MVRKTVYFTALSIVMVLFGVLYFVGITNLFFEDSSFLKSLRFLNFNSSVLALFYLIVLTIFFVVIVAIMLQLAVSYNKEKDQIASDITSGLDMAIGATSLPTSEAIKNMIDISVGMMYRENERRFVQLIEDTTLHERVDDIYYQFSQMTVDLVQSLAFLELFEKVMYWGAKLSLSKRASIMIVDHDRLNVYKTFGWEVDEKSDADAVVSTIMGTQVASKVVEKQAFVIMNNIDDFAEYSFPNKDKYDSASLVSFPIVLNGNVVAVFNFTNNTRRGYYTLGEQEILRVLYTLSNKIYEHILIKKRLG